MTQEIQKISNNSGNNSGNNGRVIVPLSDIYEAESEYVITMDMPGVEKKDVQITLDNNKLTIKGNLEELETKGALKYSEFSLYNYQRDFTVGYEIDGDKINAAMNNGVLEITIPKKEEVKPKKIEISIN